MALVHHHFEVVCSFMESSGKVVTRDYVADAGIADYDALVVAWAANLATINAATDSVISGYTFKDVFIEDALVLPVDAENNDQAFMSAKIAGDPTDSGTLSIPAASIACFVSSTGGGRDVVDTSPGSVAFLYADLFGSVNGEFTLSDGEQLNMSTLKGNRRNTASTNS